MNATRIFRQVWRINALLLLLAGLIGVVMLSAGAFLLARDAFGQRHVSDVVRDDAGAVHDENMWLEESTTVTGPRRILALKASQSYSYGSLEKDSSSTRNLLFIDLETGVSHWLMPNSKHLILEWQTVDRQGRFQSSWFSDNVQAPEWVVAEVVSKDGNEDGVLNRDDPGSLVLVRLADWKQWQLVELMERAVTHHINASRYTGIYQAKQGPHRLVYDLAEGRVISDNPIEGTKP